MRDDIWNKRDDRRIFARPPARGMFMAVAIAYALARLPVASADAPTSLKFVPDGSGEPAASVLRLAPVEPTPPRPRLYTTAALIRQPDAPRAPVVQPVPLPPPNETIGPGAATNQLAPPNIGDYSIRPIGSLTINIVPKQGQVPLEVNPTRTLEREFGATEFQREPLNYSYYWESPAFFNKPLYFEQPNLERYGYDWGIGQFWISGAQFFVKIPLLPYMMVVHPPRENVYSLGYYRPGSRAPYQINWPEVRLDAILVETAFITGLCFLIP